MYQTVLQHYGVKGMKWGVRRFQNKDGSLTYEGKYRIRQERASKTMDDIDEIIRTMPEEDKKKLGIKDSYLTKEECGWVVKRFLYKEGNKPIAFFDLLRDGDNLNVSLGTRSGEEYRGKGHATNLVKKGMVWCEKNKDKWDNIIWGTREDNAASINLAKKNKFKKSGTYKKEDKEWHVYSYKK